jgi:hypothetical protein
MIRRSSLAQRCCALGLLVLPAASGVVVACSSGSGGGVTPATDGSAADGMATDVGIDVTADTTAVDATEESSEEAGCEVDAGPIDDADLVLGLQLIGQHRCEYCHGSTLSGNNDGVASLTAEGGLAYPPNLTPDPGTGLGCWTDPQIVNAILYGVDNHGTALCAPMPQYGHNGAASLDEMQAQAIVEYLRTLPIHVNAVPNTSCPAPPPPPEAGAPDSGGDAASEAGGDAAQASDSSGEGGDQ